MTLNIIHLQNRLDRLQLSQQQLKFENITDFVIWNGILDADLPSRGISRAHKQIVNYAKENKLSEVLIAEDDFLFTGKGAFNFFVNNKPIDYDLYLASIFFGQIKEDNSVDDFAGLTFYMVNERFYDKFLSMPEYEHLDRALRYKGKYIVCNPFTVIQQNGYSDNAKSNCIYFVNRKSFFTSGVSH